MDKIESELRAMLNDTFNRSKLLVMLKDMQTETEKREERKARVKKKIPALPMTRYTEIKQNYTCRHCGAKFSRIAKLSPKDEGVASINAQGRCVVITANSPVEVDCYVCFCVHCDDYISTMPREELEQRYSRLLSRFSIQIHSDFVSTEVQRTVVRW